MEILTSASEMHCITEQRSELWCVYQAIPAYGFKHSEFWRLQGFEGVHTCLPSESLHTIVKRIVTAKVRNESSTYMYRER